MLAPDAPTLPRSGPRLSVVVPVHDAPAAALEESLSSVTGQTYTDWELCVCDDASKLSETVAVIEVYRGRDARIRVVRSESSIGTAGATNLGAEQATGEMLVVLGQDDVLHPEALAEIACAIGGEPRIDLIYFDEDGSAAEGRSSEIRVPHCLCIRKKLFWQIDGMRPEIGGARVFDLALRAAAQARMVHHIRAPGRAPAALRAAAQGEDVRVLPRTAWRSPVKKRLRTALRVWREQGGKAFCGLVLFKLGLKRSFEAPGQGTEEAPPEVPCQTPDESPPDAPDQGAEESPPDAPEPRSARQIVNSRFEACAPLHVFSVPAAQPQRISLVIDSIDNVSLYDGAGTALILAALLAEARQARLRIVTRTARARPDNLGHLLESCGIDLAHEVEFELAAFGADEHEIDVFADELFVTTSWSTTAATMASIPHEAIVYLLQDDERTFYPFGDERLRCDQVLSSRDIRFVVNTRLLFDHLVASGLGTLPEKGVWFEPAFPREVFHPRSRPAAGKRRLAFCAQPDDPRNLLLFGLELLEDAIMRGVIDLDEWDIVLVGRDIPDLVLAGGYAPGTYENLSPTHDAELAGTVDVGLCLRYSIQPGYPTLELAAGGAVVVTNRWGGKRDLSGYSRNILCGDLDRESMLSTLADGMRLAADEAQRAVNDRSSALSSSWREALRVVVAQLAEDR